jgi:hypothetical protein
LERLALPNKGWKVLVVFLAFGIMASGLTATGAWFSTTTTTKINTISSSTLLLTINGQDEISQTFSITNLKPNARELAGQVVLKNEGSIPGHLWVEIVNIRNQENSCLSPEAKMGDKSCAAGPDQGELGNFVKVTFQAVPATTASYGGQNVINASGGQPIDLVNLDPAQSFTIGAYAHWTASDNDNLAQGDSLVYDVVFHLDQIH